MSDEDDWDLWRQAVNPMATGFLRQALTKREDFHEASDPNRKLPASLWLCFIKPLRRWVPMK